jgi:hypothetical protein
MSTSKISSSGRITSAVTVAGANQRSAGTSLRRSIRKGDCSAA